MKKQMMRGAMNTKIKHHKAIDRKNMREVVSNRAKEYKFVGAKNTAVGITKTSQPTMRDATNP
jgi:hypothetical protein